MRYGTGPRVPLCRWTLRFAIGQPDWTEQELRAEVQKRHTELVMNRRERFEAILARQRERTAAQALPEHERPREPREVFRSIENDTQDLFTRRGRSMSHDRERWTNSPALLGSGLFELRDPSIQSIKPLQQLIDFVTRCRVIVAHLSHGFQFLAVLIDLFDQFYLPPFEAAKTRINSVKARLHLLAHVFLVATHVVDDAEEVFDGGVLFSHGVILQVSDKDCTSAVVGLEQNKNILLGGEK